MQEYLHDIGLSEKEAEVYLALLQVVRMSVREISETTKVRRTTVYPVLESLMEKQLVREVAIGTKKHYAAVDPERIAAYLTHRRAHLEEQYHKLDDVLPRLKSIAYAGNIGMVTKRFHGEDAIIEEYFDMCSESTEKTRVVVMHQTLFTTLSKGNQKSLKKMFPDLVIHTQEGILGSCVCQGRVLVHTENEGEHEALLITSPQYAQFVTTLLKQLCTRM